MTDYFIDDRTMTILAEQTRRLLGSTDALNGAEILETLSKVQGDIVEGSQYTVNALDLSGSPLKSGKYNKGTIFSLPKISKQKDELLFQEWVAPVDTTGNFITVEHPTTIIPVYAPISADIMIYTNVKEDNVQVTLNHHNNPIMIDWGDGIVDKDLYSSSQYTHIYSTSGYYQIKMYGGRNYITWSGEYTSTLYTFNSISINGKVIPIISNILNTMPDLLLVNLGCGVTEISSYAFENTQLTYITLPSTVKTIGTSAFENSSLTSIILPHGLETIGAGAFNNTDIRSVVIPETVTNCCGFYDCSNLKTAIIKTGSINSFPYFQNCTNLTNIIITYDGGVIPIISASIAFNNSLSIKAFYVPDELVDSYKSASGWSLYKNYIKPLSEYTE